MQSDMLSELVRQSCSALEHLDSGDVSQLENLQNMLEQICQTIDTMAEAQTPLLEQVKGSSADAVDTLQRLMSQEFDDTSLLMQTLADEVQALSRLIEQESGDASADQPVPEPVSESVGSATAEPGFTVHADDLELIIDFIGEASEHLETVEAGLLELEDKPGDNETLNKIFRAFHTIKGMAGFLNLAEIGSLAHASENLLDLARQGELVLADEKCDVIFASVDVLKKMISSLKEAADTSKPMLGYQGLASLLEKLASAGKPSNKDEQASDTGEETPAPDAKPLDKSVEAVESTPIEVVETRLVQNADRKLDTILADEPQAASAKAGPQKGKSAVSDEKIKVSTLRLDNLINMTGELAIAQLMVTEEISQGNGTDHELNRKVGYQSKIVRELQELSMSMRMVPVQGVFQKMARLVRDLSRKADKKINFTTVGEDTELDRNIVDKIADPLVHMVRNSADHGVESPTEREQAGKTAAGRIELRAFHQAGNIVIEIADDGRGLDKEKILQKALKQGIVEPNQELTDEEVFKLIFNAGFSTAEKVTSISGRGVGMDVVRKNIEALHGKVDISSTLGQGTTFTIRMPLTLAIIDGQIVQVGSQRYVIPINSMVRSFRPTRQQISSILSQGDVALTQGMLVPVVRLHELFGVTKSAEDLTDSLLVTVEEEHHRCCLLVDDLLGQQQVVIKSLGEMMGSIRGVSGGAIMGDGRVSLILDIPGLIEMARV
jgi:two-component system, chemotaxis family, sensor kinase CheA